MRRQIGRTAAGFMLLVPALAAAQPVVETYAGHPTRLNAPEGLAADDAGNLYAGNDAGLILKITPSREVIPFATTGGRTLGMCFDGSGDLYACDRGAVLRVRPDGAVSTFCREVEGEAMVAPNYPAFDDGGHLYVSDFDPSRNRIYRIDPSGHGSVFVGPQAGIDQPNGLALDAGGEYLYVSETYERTIWRIPIEGDGASAGVPQVFASWPADMGVAADSIQFDTEGNAYVATADYLGPIELLRITPQGVVSVWLTSGHFLCPTTALFAGPDLSEVFVANLCTHTIARVTNTGVRGLPLRRPARGTAAGLDLR